LESKSKHPGARTTSTSLRPARRPGKGHSLPPEKRASAISAEERIAELEEALTHERRERGSAEERLQDSLERAVRMGERLQLAEGAAKRVQARALAAEEEVVVQRRRIKRLEEENAVLRGAGANRTRALDEHLGARAESVLEKLMEMRTALMATASALDDLTHREADLNEVRARTFDDAKRILLSTAGMTYDAKLPAPPAVAAPRPPPIDISEVAELIESFRPGPITPSRSARPDSRAPKK
jgi:hypothetical protein